MLATVPFTYPLSDILDILYKKIVFDARNKWKSHEEEQAGISEYITVISEHRKAAKYYFEGKVYTEEELRTCGLTMNENNAPILIKEGIVLPGYLKESDLNPADSQSVAEYYAVNHTIDEVKLLNGIQEWEIKDI